MLKESLINQRVEEFTQESYTDHETKKLFKESKELFEKLKRLIPESNLKQYTRVLDDYEYINDKMSVIREREAYKQGLVDGFEIYSLVYPIKK